VKSTKKYEELLLGRTNEGADSLGKSIRTMKATRESYGEALVAVGKTNPSVVVLDAETKNSTYAENFKKAFPDRFFDCFIAEQNMIGMAVGMARMGKVPFVSSFAAFLSRGYDQIRMACLGETNIKVVGSHAGVSIGSDGFSQMALEDLAAMRALWNSVVLYPSDDVSTSKLVEQMVKRQGFCYMRTTRAKTPTLYSQHEDFPIGGFKIHRCKDTGENSQKSITVISAGITLHEALKAQKELEGKIKVTVIDLYCLKPINEKELQKAVTDDHIITVEDHWPEGGIGDAVLAVFAQSGKKINKLAVNRLPHSGTPEENMYQVRISSSGIVQTIQTVL